MNTYRDIIDHWGSIADFARDLDVPYERARQWRNRNSIPLKYWEPTILAASARGVRVDVLALVKIAKREADARKGGEDAETANARPAS